MKMKGKKRGGEGWKMNEEHVRDITVWLNNNTTKIFNSKRSHYMRGNVKELFCYGTGSSFGTTLTWHLVCFLLCYLLYRILTFTFKVNYCLNYHLFQVLFNHKLWKFRDLVNTKKKRVRTNYRWTLFFVWIRMIVVEISARIWILWTIEIAWTTSTVL